MTIFYTSDVAEFLDEPPPPQKKKNRIEENMTKLFWMLRNLDYYPSCRLSVSIIISVFFCNFSTFAVFSAAAAFIFLLVNSYILPRLTTTTYGRSFLVLLFLSEFVPSTCRRRHRLITARTRLDRRGRPRAEVQDRSISLILRETSLILRETTNYSSY